MFGFHLNIRRVNVFTFKFNFVFLNNKVNLNSVVQLLFSECLNAFSMNGIKASVLLTNYPHFLSPRISHNLGSLFLFFATQYIFRYKTSLCKSNFFRLCFIKHKAHYVRQLIQIFRCFNRIFLN